MSNLENAVYKIALLFGSGISIPAKILVSTQEISLLDKFDTINNALILIGTHNKMSDYIKDLYLELYYRFYRNLNYHNILITVGYDFNDRGINQKIFNWLYNPSN